jgi:Ni/Co efflux regulator RcnB
MSPGTMEEPRRSNEKQDPHLCRDDCLAGFRVRAVLRPGRGPEWHRGGHIPRTYRDRQYVVTHWQEHHLRRPPRGYEWVQVGGDYVLVAIATGLIADILLNH